MLGRCGFAKDTRLQGESAPFTHMIGKTLNQVLAVVSSDVGHGGEASANAAYQC